MNYNSDNKWETLYSADKDISYPAEGVIRIFKGKFPNLLMPSNDNGLSILDLGCGDGRNLPFLNDLGYKVSATEVSHPISIKVQEKMRSMGIEVNVEAGHAGNLPFASASFDRLLAWNSCYYMSLGSGRFEDHVAEMARVLKPGGWIIVSIPKKSSFIFNNSKPEKRSGYRIIKDDYFDGLRNGEVMRCIEDVEDLENSFAHNFNKFCHADLDLEWFGLSYHWHVFCAQKLSSSDAQES